MYYECATLTQKIFFVILLFPSNLSVGKLQKSKCSFCFEKHLQECNYIWYARLLSHISYNHVHMTTPNVTSLWRDFITYCKYMYLHLCGRLTAMKLMSRTFHKMSLKLEYDKQNTQLNKIKSFSSVSSITMSSNAFSLWFFFFPLLHDR